MNTMLKHAIAIAMAALMVSGCTASKYLKKGNQFEKAGLYEQAAKAYIVSLAAKNDNVKAMVGLKNTGQRAVDEKTTQVMSAADRDDHKTAVYRYMEMADMVSKSSKLGVQLQIPEQATSTYEDARQHYADQIYSQSQQMLDAERYQQAEALLKELKSIAPHHNDNIDEMLMLSQAEPQNQAAQKLLQQGKHRKAYTTLTTLVNTYPHYKDAAELRADALSRAQLTIRVEAFGQPKGLATDYAQPISAKVIASVNAKNNVFIKIVDGQAKILQEQRRAIAAGADNISVGQLLAAKSLLQGNITTLRMQPITTQRTLCRGYLRKEKKTRNKETGKEITEVSYDKVTYEEHTMSTSASVALSYQLVSVETGQVVLADVARSAKSASKTYIVFNGNCSQLVPGHWEHIDKKSDKDRIDDNSIARYALQSKCTKERSITSTAALLEMALNEVSETVATKINAYNPEN